ncbi:MAG: hypothetical protein IJU86_00915, partial [Firmicutes bacterium]|nr:hypothetical protein [Bacillota bacterium]
METEQIQLDLKKLNEEFNDGLCEYYKAKKGKIIWDDKYNIKDELTTIKTIWSDLLYKKCREVIQSKSNDKKVDENEVKKIYDEQLKKYENSWELTDDNFPLYFLEAFEEETIDSQEKLKQLIDFTKDDLKFKDDFYDDYFMSYIIDLLKVGEKSTLTKDNLFYVLALNKKNDLSLSTLLQCAQKFNLDHSDFERLLSFAENYTLPDAKNESKDYKKQAKAFFDLIYYMLLYSKDFSSMSGDVAKNLEIAQKIFAYISRSMPKFKHLFSEIDKYEKGVELSNYLNKEGCIKICLPEKNSDVGDIGVAIDYFKWFNEIVLDKLYNGRVFVNSYRCGSIDKLNELYNAFTSDFRKEIEEYGIDTPEDIKKELVLNRDSFGKILEKIYNNTVASSDDFNELVEFIQSKTKDIDITSNKFHLLIIDYRLNMSDMNKFLKLDKNNSLSISDISYFFNYKVNLNQSYKFKDITKFLLVAKNRFTKSKKSGNDKKRKKDVEAFCDLLTYFIRRIDENEAEYIKFEQNVFDWVDKNIPEVEFFTRGIKSDKLKYALKHRWVKFNDSSNNKLEVDFSDLQEKFESFVQQKATKYQDLNKLSKACDTLIDEFLKSKQVDPTRIQKVSKAGYEKDLKQALRVRESKSIELFIKNIAPNIIKSSNDIKIFLENINKVIDNPIDILYCNSFMNSVIKLIVDGAVDISDMLKVLKRFLAKKDEKSGGKKGTKDKLKLTTLLKCCQKIKDGSKWNLDQIEKFLGYGFANTTEKNISDSVDSFFKLLIIFVSNADLKNKMDNSDPEEADNEDNINIKEIDMTYEKFVNKILAYAKKLYFKQKNFSWSEHFEFCDSFDKLEKILSEKNINIPELTQNKLKNEIKLGENITDKNKKIKNKDIKEEDIKKIEEKNKIQIKINFKSSNKNEIDEIYKSKKFDLEIKATNNMDPGEKYKKLENMKLNELNKEQNNEKNNNINVTTNTNNENKLKANLTYSINKITNSTDNKDDNISQTTQKIGGIPVIQNSKRANIQDQGSETTLIPTIKISYLKLIAKIVLYALTVIALAAFVFSIIKAFWFLGILSFVLCFCFAFIAYKIKYKTIDERPNQISTGDLNYQQEITKPKNNELNQEPKTA